MMKMCTFLETIIFVLMEKYTFLYFFRYGENLAFS